MPPFDTKRHSFTKGARRCPFGYQFHTHGPLPTLVVGGGAGAIKGGRHLIYPGHTPLTNLQLTLLGSMGIPTEKFGDSTGQLKELSGLS